MDPRITRASATRLLASAIALPLLWTSTVPAQARDRAPAAPVRVEEDMAGALRRVADPELLGVYAARQYRPVWFDASGSLVPAAHELVGLIQTADIDGIDPRTLHPEAIDAALGALDRDSSFASRARAEIALSSGLVDLIRAMRQAPAAAMTYEHSSLRPAMPGRADALWTAANAPSLDGYVTTLGWMHPLYAQLRTAALTQGDRVEALDPATRETLARLRALPPLGKGRTILVDAANARLWMYEGDRPVDSMKVVVGKPETQTPMLAGYVRYAILNPYWNVPDNLVSGKIAANALSRGSGYLKTAGYEVLGDWTAQPARLDPAKIDWRQVAASASEVRVRQLPSAANAMGKVKFEFPNPLGIYLHDTPEKQLMLKEDRHFSNGCVRLEDAQRLGRWLFGGAMPAVASAPEQRVDLPTLVPVYITYLTAQPIAGRIVLGPDPYGRDGGTRAMASAAGTTVALARR